MIIPLIYFKSYCFDIEIFLNNP